MGQMQAGKNYYSDALKYFFHEKNISVKEILTEANISRSRFYAYLNGEGDLSMTRLMSIVTALGVDFDEFLTYAMLLRPENEIAEVISGQFVSLTDSVTQAVSLYQNSHRVGPILQVLHRINLTANAQEEEQYIQNMRATIQEIIGTTKYCEKNEIRIFLNTMLYLPYEQVKLRYNQIVNNLTKRQHFSTLSGDSQPFILDSLVELHYKMIIAALQVQQFAAADDIARHLLQVPSQEFSWHANALKKMTSIIVALRSNQIAQSKALYSQLTEAVYFMQHEQQWLRYEKIMQHNFNQLKTLVLGKK